MVGSSVGLDGFATTSSYCFKYDWPEWVRAMSGAFGSAARTIVSSSESVSEGTSVSTSLEEAHTTLQGEAFALPLNFLLVTIVHYWPSMRLGWTNMVSPWGVETGTRPFFYWWSESVLITLNSPFEMGTTPGSVEGCTTNWKNDVMLVVIFFCSGWSLNTSASIKG